MKCYTVFNVEQFDGFASALLRQAMRAGGPHRTRRDVPCRHRRDHQTRRQPGFLCPLQWLGFVQMPPRESFKDAASYLRHPGAPLTHWTAHPSRCARELGKRFGDRAYAAEELIAEMGSAFLCADLGVTPEVREDHAQYLGHWLRILQSDSRASFTAAAHAADASYAFRQAYDAALNHKMLKDIARDRKSNEANTDGSSNFSQISSAGNVIRNAFELPPLKDKVLPTPET